MKVVIYMNKKGFTLIELLGVIVLLAVIASIAFPAVQSSVNTAREKTLKENKRVIVDDILRLLKARKKRYSKHLFIRELVAGVN